MQSLPYKLIPAGARQAAAGGLLSLLLAAPAWGELQLKIEDVPSGLEQNILSRTALHEEACEAPAWRVRRLFRRLEKDIQPALQAFGYYRARIDKQLRRDQQCWHVELNIEAGPRTRVRSRLLQIDGGMGEDPQLAEMLAQLPLAEGEPLHHGDYEAIKTALREFALEHGYLDFAFTRQQLRVYPAEDAAEIDIAADSGPRYRFGELSFDEQPLSNAFIARLAQWQTDVPFDPRELSALDRRLSDSGYFSRVEVRSRRDLRQDESIPVELTLQTAPRHAWRAGIGFATDTGPRLSLGYKNRYLNTRGHLLDSELRLSPVESGVGVQYRIPGENPHQEYFSFGAKAAHEDTETAVSDSFTLGAQHVLQWHGWTQTRFIELLYEQSQVGDDSIDATLLMPGIKMSHTEADDVLRTRHGYRINLEARAAYEGLLSSSTLLQLRADFKIIHRFGDAGRVTLRAEAGSTIGDSTGDLPASLRFFAGGDNSVRGYAYESLGPETAGGTPVGARNLLTSSVEYEHPIVDDDWWLGAFVDAGNAFDTDAIRLRAGYGVGVRWYSPVGRLRFDLAFPDDTSQDEWRIHFGLGADL